MLDGPEPDLFKSAVKPVTFKENPELGVTLTSAAASELEQVVVLEKLLEEKPVLQGELDAAAPFTLDKLVPVALIATELREPFVALE